jgi:hypothetical protein
MNTKTGFSIERGNGAGIVIPVGHRMVKASEKKLGKGKGKTIAFCLLPAMPTTTIDNWELFLPMLVDLCIKLENGIVTRIAREGGKAVTVDQLNATALALEYSNQTFSEESVAAWFDAEMAELLAYEIAVAKGWNVDALSNEQMKLLETKCAAYKASYVVSAKKGIQLDPAAIQELLRVLALTEVSGPIPDAIREKITPKDVGESLGFA